MTVRYPQGYTVALLHRTHTHTQAHKRKLTSALLSHFLFFVPAFGTFCLLLSIYKFQCINPAYNVDAILSEYAYTYQE